MKMKFWSRPTFLFMIYLTTLPQLYSSSPALSVPERFLQCLDTQPSDHGSPNSRTAVIPTNATFSTNLMNGVRNLRFASPSTRKPEAIVAAVTETHIRATISCCKLLNLELRVRSGGHDYEGFSYTSPVSFVILDMFNFDKIDIDMTDETVWVQAGASLGELYYNIASKSKVHAFPAGVCPKVGAGGHFSGGGFGNLMRKHGLSIDHIIDAQIMDANGKVYRDRRSMGEDVFWAIRGGGGGSYGVILAWKIKLIRVPEKVTVFKLERTVREGAVNLVWKWQQVAPVIDRDLFIRLEIKPINRKISKGKTIKVSFIGMFLGLPERLLKITDKSFPELHLKKEDCMVKKWIDSTVFWANYPEKAPIQLLLKRVSTNEYYWKRTSDFVQTPISKEGLAKIFQTMIDHSPLPRRVWMQWNPWGGKMAEISSDATAFVHRAGNIFMIEHFMNWYKPGDELEDKFLAIARSFKEAMAPYVSILCLITIFSLSPIILSLAENISIDCGSATRSYVDSSNVTWVGDEGFVTTGESIQIPDVVTKPLNTLRYFPTGKTNCYTNIPATKHQKTLVRTKFYYENYDGKSSPPSFDVVYDGKHRDSVEITESSVNDEEAFYFSEVIFAPVNGNISVCLFRTSPSDNPFVSSIEVYGLDKGMYDDLGPNEGLIVRERVTYGAKEIISYPSDPYGRLWAPSWSQDNPTLTDLTTSAASIDISKASNRPPEIVMWKALSGESLTLTELSLPTTGLPIYLALYFSEPQSLGRTQKRSFNIFLDQTQVGSVPIVPALGKASQVVLRDIVATSRSLILFQSTDDSTLPPIINGLELYSISNSREGGGGGGGGQNGGGTDDSQGSGEAKPRANNAVGGEGKANGGKKKKNKLPLILGVTLASVFAILSSTFGAIFMRKRRNAKPHSNTAPAMATGHGTGTGMSPLVVGQQFASDDINNSYVDHNNHH